MRQLSKVLISALLLTTMSLMAENVYDIKDIKIKNDIFYHKNSKNRVTGILKSYYESGALSHEANIKNFTFKNKINLIILC